MDPGEWEVTRPGVRAVPVGNEGHAAIVSEAKYDRVAGYTWSLLRAKNGRFYAHRHGPDGPVYMHRLIAGTPPGMETDHENGNGLDNRDSNLRIATQSQNNANRGKPQRRAGRAPVSAFKGVIWAADRQRWRARIKVDGKVRELGGFTDETAAAHAYDAAALAAWGPFARLNFPAEVTA